MRTWPWSCTHIRSCTFPARSVDDGAKEAAECPPVRQPLREAQGVLTHTPFDTHEHRHSTQKYLLNASLNPPPLPLYLTFLTQVRAHKRLYTCTAGSGSENSCDVESRQLKYHPLPFRSGSLLPFQQPWGRHSRRCRWWRWGCRLC